jgi:formylglycine-generating enzyme required for sulfatase activity
LLGGHFDRIGGLKGLIEDAAERALRGLGSDEDVPLPSGPPAKRRDDLGSATFVPALTQINDQGVIRRVAAWTDFNEDQRELLERFEQWRLVIRRGGADGGTFEVAHEALFREWTRLKGWLEPERARLEALRSLQVDAANWERNGKSPGFLNHRGKRLAEARSLSEKASYARRLLQRDFDYLGAACARARRVQALVGALVVLLALGGIAWWRQDFLREQYHWRVMMGSRVLTIAQEKEKAANPGSEFTECLTGCPTMVVVPAGNFRMGSPESEKDRDGDEIPQHQVMIVKPFAVGKTEVTFAEWDACVAAGSCTKASDNNWGRGDRPVINVSWDDAQEYVAWLSRVTGKEYRLLSEAEWEYAARAGNSGRYGRSNMLRQESVHTEGPQQAQAGGYLDRGQYIPFSEATPGSEERYSFTDGDEKVQLDQQAWFRSNSDDKTQPVRKKAANAFGLHDMHGNVWEWVEDPWHDGYQNAPTDGSPWVEDGDASQRVVRGGSWNSNPQDLRAALRYGLTSDYRLSFLGFRLARTLSP